MSSHELYEILLHRYHLQMEMLAGTYVLAMTTVGDTQEGLDRLGDALLEIDKEIDTKQAGWLLLKPTSHFPADSRHLKKCGRSQRQ